MYCTYHITCNMILSYIRSKGGLVNDIYDVFGTSALLVLLNNTSINTITKINKQLPDHTCTCTCTTYYNVNVYFNIVRELMEKDVQRRKDQKDIEIDIHAKVIMN